MIEAYDLSARDIDSPSDPFLYITCNDKTFNDRENWQLDISDPKFYKYFDFEGTFPGSSPIKIEVYDYDEIFGDDLIGTTILDLEDRYFSLEWLQLEEKPIEYRQLYHESSSISQGVVKCWLEINPIEELSKQKTWDISAQPPEEFEIRIAVFNAVDIPMMDVEGTSDVFFKGFFDSKQDVQETDTHYRNQDGKPDFQFRMVYRKKITHPVSSNDLKFTLQAYDRDFFKSNDMIGEATIDLKKLVETCSWIKRPLNLNKKFYNEDLKPNKFQQIEFDPKDESRFWLKMEFIDTKKANKRVTRGSVKV